MPHMGGIELQMFAEALKPDIRFLFISAFNDKLDPDIFYLQKPFAFGELARKINEILTA
jgi:two-component SAPR family response regulator